MFWLHRVDAGDAAKERLEQRHDYAPRTPFGRRAP
jgi:hypothetical protein